MARWRRRARAGLFSRGGLLATLAAGWFLIFGMRFVFSGILPTIITEFRITEAQAGIAMTTLWATYGVMQFPAGVYGDRVGERLLLVASLLLSAVALAAFLVVPTFIAFVLVTALFGLGTGLYGPPRGTVLARVFADRDTTAFGVVFAAGSIGGAVLPALAAVGVASLGWRLTIAIVAPAFLLVGVALWWLLAGHGAEGGTAPPVRTALAGARRAIADREVLLPFVGMTLMLFGYQGITAFLTVYLTSAKGFTQGGAGVVLGLLFVVGALAQAGVGRVAERIGQPRTMLVVGLVSIPPLLALPLVSGLVPVVMVSALVGVRISIAPVSNPYMIARLPADVEGTAWGLLRTGFFMFGSFGSTFVGYMAGAGQFGLAIAVVAGLTAVASLCYVPLVRTA